MANPEHLKILKQGVKQWNKWREEQPEARSGEVPLDVSPDLSRDLSLAELEQSKFRVISVWGMCGPPAGPNEIDRTRAQLRDADLRGAELAEAHLSGANLMAADFAGADLSHADLRGADLRGAYLVGANLSRAHLLGANLNLADLRRANLSGAFLIETDLSGTYLIEANLGGAHLFKADLTNAFLRDADLREAKLTAADFTQASLRGADFAGAESVGTKFSAVDLSAAVRLETIVHKGPSSIDIHTIYESRGKIPEVFLRGCGVPDEFITFIASLVGSPIRYHTCFISYSSQDQEFAERLHADLQAKGVRCWFATEDLKIGDKFQEKIEESIPLHDKLLLVLSENSVRSPWVEREVQAAFEREHKSKKLVLFPIRLDETDMETTKAWAADIRRTRHIGEFGQWREHDSYKKALERLLRDLKAGEAVGSG